MQLNIDFKSKPSFWKAFFFTYNIFNKFWKLCNLFNKIISQKQINREENKKSHP